MRCVQRRSQRQRPHIVVRRGLHLSRPALAMDFMKYIPFMKRPAPSPEVKKVEFDEAEEEELRAVSSSTVSEESTEISEAAEEPSEYEPLKLSEFVHRVSKIKPVTISGVTNLEPQEFENIDLIEIGLKAKEPHWRTQLNGFKFRVWQSKTPVYDSESVYRLAQLAVGVHLGLVEINWPKEGGVVDPQHREPVTLGNKFTEIAMQQSVPEIDVRNFSLANLNTRFAVAKKLSQLTGRTIPDAAFTHAETVGDLLAYHENEAKKHQKYGLFQEDPYNPYDTKVFIDPAQYEGTNVKISV